MALRLFRDEPYWMMPSSSSSWRQEQQQLAHMGSTDITETDKELVFSTDVPGMRPDDVKVRVIENNVLHITGERKREAKQDSDTSHRVERSFGTFERHFRLPEGIDATQITAKVDGGVLTVRVPRAVDSRGRAHNVSVS